jgi:hypothetical protein
VFKEAFIITLFKVQTLMRTSGLTPFKGSLGDSLSHFQ